MRAQPQPIQILEECVRDAESNQEAEHWLRCIVKSVALNGPVSALTEVGKTLLEIHRRDTGEAR